MKLTLGESLFFIYFLAFQACTMEVKYSLNKLLSKNTKTCSLLPGQPVIISYSIFNTVLGLYIFSQN